MSIRVDIDALSDTVASRGTTAFLLTTADDGRPHATHVAVEVDGSLLRCGIGRRTAGNATVRPLVSLLWPPTEDGGYSLIVDGELAVTGSADEPGAEITVTSAVLHRPAPGVGSSAAAGSVDGCGADCVPLESSDDLEAPRG